MTSFPVHSTLVSDLNQQWSVSCLDVASSSLIGASDFMLSWEMTGSIVTPSNRTTSKKRLVRPDPMAELERNGRVNPAVRYGIRLATMRLTGDCSLEAVPISNRIVDLNKQMSAGQGYRSMHSLFTLPSPL